MRKKVTYDQIRRIDPEKFSDLEQTMRMLYDHGNMQISEGTDYEPVIAQTNASLREP